ncbi:hypothetical protein QZH41_018273 [Actinostola sp. cb2023]|nr:hypothetical protein QZH41_018273 [Actinostola sp. cb2023]
MSSGNVRTPYTHITDNQREILLRYYQQQGMTNTRKEVIVVIKKAAQETGLGEERIKKWISNEKARSRKRSVEVGACDGAGVQSASSSKQPRLPTFRRGPSSYNMFCSEFLRSDQCKGLSNDEKYRLAGKGGGGAKQYQPTRPRVRPAVYEGTTSWEDYEAQFEMVADLNDWNSEEKAAYLAVSLVGQARTVLGDLSGEERRNFKSLTAALATRFGTENKTEMFRVNVKNRQREKDESLPELAQAIRRLTRQAYPSAAVDLRDILARDYFLDAITETDMRWKIRQARPKSLNEALGVAVELEAFMSAEKQRQRSARAAQVTTNSAENDKTKKTNDGLREEIEELKRLVQGLCSVQQNHQRFRGDGCWACGDKNHLRRDCPKRAQTTKQQVNSPLSGNDSLPSSRA